MAGKDVYVEKPASHNVFEGRIAVQAARKYGRIVQHGTQSRSSGGWWNTIAAVKSGKYGKLLVSHGYCCKPRGSIGIKNPEKAPPPLDFNMWVGPAPMQDFHRNLVHYNWHWFWDFGNGDIGNQGVHQMDIALWALEDENGVSGWPKSVISLGGRFGYKDQGQTPNSQLSIFDYGETKVVFSVRGLKHPRKVDNEFYLEEGAIKRGKFYPKGSDKGEGLPKMNTEKNPGGHFDNFIYAVRSRKNTDLNADILKGHYSAGLCHLGNISYRLGADVPFNKKTKALGDDKYAHDTFAELSEYLSGANKINLQETNYRLGKKLAFDGKSEKFLNDNQANTMLTREYRKGFEIPSNIA
jgi:hypothetical protein